MTDHDKLHAHIEEMISGFLNEKRDWRIEFASDNSLLREVVHVAVDMIED